jgi:eukaryotic-like serine/threonine-protein kinase
MIGKTLSHYRVVQELGRGGMGEVYVADDLNLNRKVALKFLPEIFTGDLERMARFEREAKLLASLNHPNIAAIYGLEQAEGKRFIVMELVEGQSLAQRLSKGPLPIEEALGICRQIAEGLESAHEKIVIHRDLKPANVMITDGDKVKILDFGLAKALSGEAQSISASQSPTITEAMTQPGIILGTAAYMSPEQAKGKAVDKRADIWAFGCILYECLTGRIVYEGETITETLAAILKGEPDWSLLPAGLPSHVVNVLQRCLQKDPGNRFRDIGDVRLELEKPLVAETKAYAKTRVSKREIAAWAAAAGLAIIAGVLVWIAYSGKPRNNEAPVVSYLLPPADSVACFRDGFAVSPDGRKIAFVSLSSKGERLLWVRDLGRAESVALAGTNGAGYPFWSPDGKNIGFLSNGWLKRISVEGGPIQQLCRGSMWGGLGTWGSSGNILFGQARTAGFCVSDTGGAPAFIPILEGVFCSSFIGDGNRFVFSKFKNSKSLAFSASLDRPDSCAMIKGMTDVGGIEWAGADWFMLYHYAERTLVVQRADPETGNTLGPVKLLAERVPAPNASPSFSVSPAGLAAFVVNPPEAQNDYASRLTWVDRQGNVVGRLGETRGYWNLRISHDGRHVATNPDDDIWIYDTSTGMPVRLTREMDSGLQSAGPVWAPRDDHVLGSVSGIEADKQGVRNYDISGGQGQEIIKATEASYASDWSRDGRYALITRNFTTNADLAYYDFSDKQLKPFLSTAAYEDFGAFSPDGHWVAYCSNASGSFEIYVRSFPKGDQEKRVSFNGGMHPRWRGDGKELFFLTSDWTVMSASVEFQPSLEIGPPVRLFQMQMADICQGLISPYDVSPDGKKFLVIVPVQSAPVPLTLIQNWKAYIER